LGATDNKARLTFGTCEKPKKRRSKKPTNRTSV